MLCFSSCSGPPHKAMRIYRQTSLLPRDKKRLLAMHAPHAAPFRSSMEPFKLP